MTDQHARARRALRAALEVRRRAGVDRSDPVCVFDLAERLKLEVKFCSGSSFGGMYSKTSGAVLVPTLRPPGRQATTCAHEMGHWFFNHGTRVDEISVDDTYLSDSPEEQLADMFSHYLLMPPWAVNLAFAKRRWTPQSCGPLELGAIASQLGVGYETLVQHLRWSLKQLPPRRAEELLKISPKEIRRSVSELAHSAPHLVVVDRAWEKVAIDLRMEDRALIPAGSHAEGRSIRIVGACSLGEIVEGVRPGIGRVQSSDGAWSSFVRVCRKEFVGRSIYRHLEDPDVD